MAGFPANEFGATTGGPPSGPAGGDLSGSYPNPTIKPSVALTGAPIAPTPALNDNSTKLATTAFVAGLLSAGLTNVVRLTPTAYDASSNLFPTTGGNGPSGAVQEGDLFPVSVSGTLGGVPVVAGKTMLLALTNTPGQTSVSWYMTEFDLGFTPEDVANKSQDMVADVGSTVKYPSVFAVQAAIDASRGFVEVALSGTQDGSNKVFTTATDVSASVTFLKYGDSFLTLPYDYTLSGTTLTLTGTQPAPGVSDTLHFYEGDVGTSSPVAAPEIHYVSGVPSNSLGVDGDTAIDLATQTIYGPKTGGVWPAGVVFGGGTNTWLSVSSASDTVINDPNTLIPLDTPISGNPSNLLAGQFVAPTNGQYEMIVSVLFSSDSGRILSIEDFINGSFPAIQASSSAVAVDRGGTGFFGNNNMAIIRTLTAGDTWGIYGTNSDGAGTITVRGSFTNVFATIKGNGI